MQSYYCVIPARGASKRILNKNIQEVAGIPLFGHVTKNAIASNVFNEVKINANADADSIQWTRVITQYFIK